MKVTFLGTGTSQGVPMVGCRCEVCQSSDWHDKRLRSSIMITEGGHNIMIDCGPDFRHQMLRAGVDSLDAIVLTHEHKDHTGGLDDVRAFNYIQRRSMMVYAESRVACNVIKDYGYAFADHKYPGVPNIEMIEVDSNTPFSVASMEFTPIRGYHHKLPVLGYRVGDLCYITDMNSLPEESKEKMHGLETLIITALRHEKHMSHFTLSEALSLIDELKPKRAYLTHISHQLGLYESVENTLPKGVYQAYDRLEIESK